ncbi:nuclear transport factor 2 family protein [Sphingopyxis witflariensis]|uniref:SnoaL-like domain-containing protein n=1 Tax=Sphingopyxis witflariensis TaxID=173675 RepID=A0A246JIW6_9SPHN|nr:nuclear transport factor 2 family protein [Sphingopyxis witflariensis]OWQ92574.1 hypothetical protein CDQ91_17435 [Sphingopyxis witflariensis]
MTIQQVIDQAALRQTAELYAQGADRRDKKLWADILTDDCVLEGPGFTLSGRDAVLTSLDVLATMYTATQHRIHNQTVTITGDTALGETYCTADHISQQDGRKESLSWAIRYQDQWRREDGVWRFCDRKLLLDWEERRAL